MLVAQTWCCIASSAECSTAWAVRRFHVASIIEDTTTLLPECALACVGRVERYSFHPVCHCEHRKEMNGGWGESAFCHG